jgi:hypothetical protein
MISRCGFERYIPVSRGEIDSVDDRLASVQGRDWLFAGVEHHSRIGRRRKQVAGNTNRIGSPNDSERSALNTHPQHQLGAPDAKEYGTIITLEYSRVRKLPLAPEAGRNPAGRPAELDQIRFARQHVGSISQLVRKRPFAHVGRSMMSDIRVGQTQHVERGHPRCVRQAACSGNSQ